MNKLKIIIKMLPIIGDFIHLAKSEKQKDAEWWASTIADLVRSILTALTALNIIT